MAGSRLVQSALDYLQIHSWQLASELFEEYLERSAERWAGFVFGNISHGAHYSQYFFVNKHRQGFVSSGSTDSKLWLPLLGNTWPCIKNR